MAAAMFATAVTAEEAQAIGFKKVSLLHVSVDMHSPKSVIPAILMEAYLMSAGHDEVATDQCTRKRVQGSRRWTQVSISKQLEGTTSAAAIPICFNSIPWLYRLCSQVTAHVADLLCRYYDVKVGGGQTAKVGDRVAVHYEARWKGVTFMTSRQVIFLI